MFFIDCQYRAYFFHNSKENNAKTSHISRKLNHECRLQFNSERPGSLHSLGTPYFGIGCIQIIKIAGLCKSTMHVRVDPTQVIAN